MNVLSLFALVWRLSSGLLTGAVAMLCPVDSRHELWLAVNRAEHRAEVRLKHLGALMPNKLEFISLKRLVPGLLVVMLLLCFAQPALAVPPGTVISNVARATFLDGGGPEVQTESNEVLVITVAAPTPSTIELLAYDPNDPNAEFTEVPLTYYSTSGAESGPFVISPLPVPVGTSVPLSLGTMIPLQAATEFTINEPVFIRLTDLDQNLDSASIDTVVVAVNSPMPGDTEILRFVESDPTSGVFVGYIQSLQSLASGTLDGSFNAMHNTVIDLSYVDATDPGDTSFTSGRFVAAGELLFVTKRADREIASIGEFIRYTIAIENLSEFTLADIEAFDRLPQGTRYQSASYRLGGRRIDDPSISSDGRGLTFALSTLGAGETIELAYVVQIGRTHAKQLTNSVFAHTGSISSNVASTTVRLREDLFRGRCIIVGQIIIGDCDTLTVADSVVGLSGARVFLEDGTSVVTDTRGFYHFEAVTPGAHVVQLDLASWQHKYLSINCAENNRHAGRAYSQFVDLQPGTMWRADFYVIEKPEPPSPEGAISVALDGRLDDSVVQYSARVTNAGVPVAQTKLSVMLPEEMTYVVGSSYVGDTIPIEPRLIENVLTFDLDSLSDEQNVVVRFEAVVTPQSEKEEMAARAVLLFDSPRERNQRTSPVTHIIHHRVVRKSFPLPTVVFHPRFASFSAELGKWAKTEIGEMVNQLDGIRILQAEVTGHSDSIPISARSRHIFADNYALSQARAESVGRFLAEVLQLEPSQLIVTGVGPDHPIETNSTAEGRFLNRRVELRLIAQGEEDLSSLNVVQSGETATLATEGAVPEERPEIEIPPEMPAPTVPEFSPARLDSLDPTAAMLWPEEGFYPPLPSLKVAIKHGANRYVSLYLNGRQVSALDYLNRTRSLSGEIVVSRWSGIDLFAGMNRLVAIVQDSASLRVDTLFREVYYSGPPVQAELIDKQSILFADGQTPIIVAVLLSDHNGYPARTGVVGEVRVDPPFVLQREIDLLQSNPLTGLDHRSNQYQIGLDGIARIRLMPTSQPGEVVLNFGFVDDEQEVRVWIDPREREWIMVGLTEGTVGYTTVSGNMESLRGDEIDDQYYFEERTAFFAKGRIKGEWLLTMAYDSKRQGVDSANSLHHEVDPEAYYTLYGDATVQTYDAPATGRLFVKMERRSFYALFGDYTTGLTVTELTRYSRSFNGVKVEVHKSGGQVSAFLSESSQGYVKDELPGDGTSGPYQLSRNDLVMNSEKIRIETRDRYRSEVIHAQRELRRYLDYSIDYLTGEVFFREPVTNRDANLNPVFVVIDYEALDAGGQSYTYGGRAAIRSQAQSLEVGTSYIHEGQAGLGGDLGGVDVSYQPIPGTRVKAELAFSAVKRIGGTDRGRGYLAEITHNRGGLSGKLYFREQQAGFGLGQQNISESGTRKIGLEATRRFREQFSLEGVAYRQYNLTSEAERDQAELRLNYAINRWRLRTGFRHSEDRLTADLTNRTTQIMFGGDYRFAGDLVRLRLDHEQAIGKSENRDFPTLTRIGLEYQPVVLVTLFAEQEYAHGSFGKSADVRLGVKARPWSGLQALSTLDARKTEYGERLFSTLGLKQSIRLNESWSVDGALDHTRTVADNEVLPYDSAVPPAVGSLEDFTALSTGVAYRNDNWSWTSRFEIRDGERANKYAFTAGAYGEPEPGLGISAAVQMLKISSEAKDTKSKVKLGMVYRPSGNAWTVLNQVNVSVDRHREAITRYDNWRVVHNINLNVKANEHAQIAFKFGSKYVRDMIVDEHYNGYTALLGIEFRRDLSPKWDVGLHASGIHSFNVRISDYSTGLSFGRSVYRNSWVSLGYNVTGFKDKDFAAAGYTAAGPFFRFRFKFDQESVLEIAHALGIFEPSAPSPLE